MTWKPTSRFLDEKPPGAPSVDAAPPAEPVGASEAALRDLRGTKAVPEAFIQNKAGTLWGTEGDLILAHLIYQHFKRSAGGAKVKPPNWAAWSNEIRELRERLNQPASALTEVFERAAAADDWGRRILSPGQLGRHWEQLIGLVPTPPTQPPDPPDPPQGEPHGTDKRQ